jgi:hypothetical protein
MAQYERSYTGQMAETEGREISGWAVGFITFASVMMVILGFFHFIEGLAAVIEDQFIVVRNDYALEIDVTTWGWFHMIGGVILVLAGIGVMTGSFAARLVAIFLAVLSATWNFYSIPYYPVWSILMIALSIGVIWALIAHGSDLDAEARETRGM